MNLGLRLLEKRDLPQYKADMQGAFQLGAQEGGCFAAGELVLPESDIERSLGAEGATATGGGGRANRRRGHRCLGPGEKAGPSGLALCQTRHRLHHRDQ